jgi:hypothetical protein
MHVAMATGLHEAGSERMALHVGSTRSTIEQALG